MWSKSTIVPTWQELHVRVNELIDTNLDLNINNSKLQQENKALKEKLGKAREALNRIASIPSGSFNYTKPTANEQSIYSIALQALKEIREVG